MNGLASNYGLYMFDSKDIPQLSPALIESMKEMEYHEIAYEVLFPFLFDCIDKNELKSLLSDAYCEKQIPTDIQRITGKTYILWLTNGPTYSFKDYAARFFGRILNYFLKNSKTKRVVVVATSGDTGGAVADALHNLDNIENVVFFPKESISERQRRQMTTLKANIHAVEVNGDFDICQAIVKRLLADKSMQHSLLGETDRLTSANSISVGRLLPQAVYPFFAYSRVAKYEEPLITSIPSGNFGDMLGTLLAKKMGLPISKIICGVNENKTFPMFLSQEMYSLKPSVKSPSTAMIVSHPSNIARLIDMYGGHIYDERDSFGNIIKEGIVDKNPNFEDLRNDLFSVSVSNEEHYEVIREVYDNYGIIMEPHGAVGWKALDAYLNHKHNTLSVIYETADPGKFPVDIKKAISVRPNIPNGIAGQAQKKERIYRLNSEPDHNADGTATLSKSQYSEVKKIFKDIFTS